MYSSHGFAAERIRHLSNFVDLVEWNPAAVGLDLATETDRGPGRDSYVYFGRLSREKGLETLLQAQAAWQAKAAVSGERPLRLVILGDGPVAGKLKAMADRYVAAIARLTAFVDVLLEICALSCEPFDPRGLRTKNG